MARPINISGSLTLHKCTCRGYRQCVACASQANVQTPRVKKDATRMEDVLASLWRAVDAVECNNTRQKQRIHQMQNGLGNLALIKQAFEMLHEAIHVAQNEANEAKRQRAKQHRLLDEAVADEKCKAEKLEKAEQKIAHLHTQQCAAADELKTQTATFHDMQLQLEKLREKTMALEEQQSENCREKDETHATLAALRTENVKLQLDLDENDRKQRRMEQEMASLRKELTRREQSESSFALEMANKEKRLTELQSTLTDLSLRLRRERKERDRSRSQSKRRVSMAPENTDQSTDTYKELDAGRSHSEVMQEINKLRQEMERIKRSTEFTQDEMSTKREGHTSFSGDQSLSMSGTVGRRDLSPKAERATTAVDEAIRRSKELRHEYEQLQKQQQTTLSALAATRGHAKEKTTRRDSTTRSSRSHETAPIAQGDVVVRVRVEDDRQRSRSRADAARKEDTSSSLHTHLNEATALPLGNYKLYRVN